ncbi:hypothetical protein [Aeromicrobium marinum]|nr:hypothetical protein [Aeromicrobium marinum]
MAQYIFDLSRFQLECDEGESTTEYVVELLNLPEVVGSDVDYWSALEGFALDSLLPEHVGQPYEVTRFAGPCDADRGRDMVYLALSYEDAAAA